LGNRKLGYRAFRSMKKKKKKKPTSASAKEEKENRLVRGEKEKATQR